MSRMRPKVALAAGTVALPSLGALRLWSEGWYDPVWVEMGLLEPAVLVLLTFVPAVSLVPVWLAVLQRPTRGRRAVPLLLPFAGVQLVTLLQSLALRELPATAAEPIAWIYLGLCFAGAAWALVLTWRVRADAVAFVAFLAATGLACTAATAGPFVVF